jgi:rhodanese-related sulfurtransferase
VALFTLGLAVAAGVARGAEPARVAGVNPGVVDGATARKLVASGVKVVDVRTPAEFAAGHVPGAINIPFDEVAARHAEVGPPSTPVLVYCKTGRRSEIAARALRDRGFTGIYDLRSYDEWVRTEPKR